MAALDMQAQQQFHIPGSILMENAGSKVWQYLESIESVVQSDKPLLFAAGSGNNGGDSLVAARHAYSRFPERVVVVYVTKSSDSSPRKNWSLQKDIIRALKVPELNWPEDKAAITELASEASLIVDGISGTGMRGALRDNAAALVSLLNSSSALRAAIDIPSGITDTFRAGSPHFTADVTLTMGLPKVSLYLPAGRGACGTVVVINPGFPEKLLADNHGFGHLYSFRDFYLPPMAKTAYKNLRGHAAVFAGSVGFTGAAILASKAAARVRTGLVTLHVDDALYSSFMAAVGSVMVRPLPAAIDASVLAPFSAYLAGPGWGMDRNREQFLRVLLESSLPGVVDADGIRHLAAVIGKEPVTGPCVITPHPGELAFFAGTPKETVLENPLPLMEKIARRYNLTVVLKSHVTYVVSPDGRYGVIDGMNPALGTGGSGDVLAGIIAGFLAQGIPAFDAALQGVLLQQEAGKICFEKKGWFLSEDLLPYLSELVKETGV